MKFKKVEDLYKEAHQLVAQAKALLESGGELTDEQKSQIDAWLQQAEEIEKNAVRLEKALEKDLDLVEAQEKTRVEAQKEEEDARTQKSGFSDFGEYMQAIKNYREKGVMDPRLHEIEEKALAGNQGDLGGFLIQPEHRQEILTTRGENSILRGRARVVPMGSRVVPFPAIDLTRGAAGQSAFYGGMAFYWVEEGNEITESDVYFREIELHSNELAGLSTMSGQLLRDSIVSMEAFLSGPGSFGGGLAWAEDYAFLRGSGVGKPVGILNADCGIAVTRNTASDFKFVDAVTMVSKALLSNEPVWLMNQSVMPKLMQFVDAAGNYIWTPNARDGSPDRLLGRPIIWTEKLPALGTAGDVCLVDASFYLIGDRQQMTIDWSEHVEFKKNKKVFRILESVDGQPWLNAAITLADGATQVSPIITLN